MNDSTTGQPIHLRVGENVVVDWPATLTRLDRVLRIRTTPIGMKLFETVGEMEAIPKIRRPKDIHTADQIVSIASRLNWTVGITGADLVGPFGEAHRGELRPGVGVGDQPDEAATAPGPPGHLQRVEDHLGAHM